MSKNPQSQHNKRVKAFGPSKVDGNAAGSITAPKPPTSVVGPPPTSSSFQNKPSPNPTTNPLQKSAMPSVWNPALSASNSPVHVVPLPNLVPPSPILHDPKELMRGFPKDEVAITQEVLGGNSQTEPLDDNLKPLQAPTTPSRITTLKDSTSFPASNDGSYVDIINSAVMMGFNPAVRDQVFTLEKYPLDAIGIYTPSVKSTQRSRVHQGIFVDTPPPRSIEIKNKSVINGCDEETVDDIKEGLVKYDNSYTLFEKLLIIINLIIFFGILFTCYVFIKIYTHLHPQEVGQLFDIVLRTGNELFVSTKETVRIMLVASQEFISLWQ